MVKYAQDRGGIKLILIRASPTHFSLLFDNKYLAKRGPKVLFYFLMLSECYLNFDLDLV